MSRTSSRAFNGGWVQTNTSDTHPYLHKRVQCKDVLPTNIVELDHSTLQKRAIGKVTKLGRAFHTSDCQEVSLCAPLDHHLWNQKEENGQHEGGTLAFLQRCTGLVRVWIHDWIIFPWKITECAPQNMPHWHENYVELKAMEKKQIEEKLSPFPLLA